MCLRRQILEQDSAEGSCYVQEYAGGDVDYTYPLQVLEEEEEDVGAGNKYDKANDLVHYQEIYQETNIWKGTCH